MADPDTMTAPGTRVAEWTNGDSEPVPDVIGQANPFEDLWLSANPIFVDVC